MENRELECVLQLRRPHSTLGFLSPYEFLKERPSAFYNERLNLQQVQPMGGSSEEVETSVKN